MCDTPAQDPQDTFNDFFQIIRQRPDGRFFDVTQVVDARDVSGPEGALEYLENPVDDEIVVVRYAPGDGITMYKTVAPKPTFIPVTMNGAVIS